MADLHPQLARLVCAVSPGDTDDVVTSPYNATLALHELRQHATCVIPVCNDALTQVSKQDRLEGAGSASGPRIVRGSHREPWTLTAPLKARLVRAKSLQRNRTLNSREIYLSKLQLFLEVSCL